MTKFLIILPLFCFLTSCGPGSGSGSGSTRLKGNSPQSATQDGSTTGGVDENNNAYVTLSPTEQVQRMKEAVGITTQNKDFALRFKSATITPAAENKDALDVSISDGKSNSDLVFEGTVEKKEDTYVGEFKEKSGNYPDYRLEVACNDKDCDHGNLLLHDDLQNKAGFIVNTDDAVVNNVVPTGETEDQAKKEGLEILPQGTKGKLHSTEIIPGITTYTFTTPDSKVTLGGTITQSNEDSEPTFQPNLSLVGQAPDKLVFQIAPASNPKKPEEKKMSFVEVKKITPVAMVKAEPPQECPVHVSGDARPIVNKILKEECTSPKVLEQLATWKKNRDSRTGLESFLEIYSLTDADYRKNFVPDPHKSKKDVDKEMSKANDFAEMLNTLQSETYPQFWGMVVFKENTGFDKSLSSGLWQITEPVALKTCKINLKQRNEVVPSTKCAITYYNELFDEWKKAYNEVNIKMVLAAYNAGMGGVKTSLFVPARQTFTRDFWEMCRLTTNTQIKNITCKYVPVIIAAMITSLDPQGFGMTNIKAMEAK